jgi:hypothetical protein
VTVDHVNHVDHFQRKIAYVDAVVDDVAAAIEREQEQCLLLRTCARRNGQMVRDALDGGFFDAGEFDYDLHGWHVGVVADGPTASDVLQRMGQQLGVRSFVATGEVAWGWFATDRLEELPEADVYLGVGDPMNGADGFRATHRQAVVACHVAARLGAHACRYNDVTIEAAALGDETAATTFVERELGLLANTGEWNHRLRATLSAYLGVGQNAAAAGYQLHVSDRTVAYQLRICEDILGGPVGPRAAELQVALRWGRVLRMFA